MKRIIEEVLRAEEKVGTILKQARSNASEIERSAEKEISERMSDAKQQARETIITTVEDAKKEAEHIREEKLEKANREKDTLLNNNRDIINHLVDNICDIVLATECEKDNK